MRRCNGPNCGARIFFHGNYQGRMVPLDQVKVTITVVPNGPVTVMSLADGRYYTGRLTEASGPATSCDTCQGQGQRRCIYCLAQGGCPHCDRGYAACNACDGEGRLLVITGHVPHHITCPDREQWRSRQTKATTSKHTRSMIKKALQAAEAESAEAESVAPVQQSLF